MSWIAGASRLHWEIKGEINKSQNSNVYMYNTRELRLGSVHTGSQAFSHALKQIKERRPPSSDKRLADGTVGVVSEDEAGEAPSVSLREIIHAHVHLPPRTRRVITTEEEQGACQSEAQLPFQEKSLIGFSSLRPSYKTATRSGELHHS